MLQVSRKIYLDSERVQQLAMLHVLLKSALYAGHKGVDFTLGALEVLYTEGVNGDDRNPAAKTQDQNLQED
jgi:hypothetical protein